MQFFIIFFLLSSIAFGANLASDKLLQKREEANTEIYETGLKACTIYKAVEGKGHLEITHALQEDASLDRRFVLFEYPSKDLLVKGYISYVPSCAKEPLVVFLRGGGLLFGLKSPANPYSFFGNYTVVGTTYRGGVSQGFDEYGGADVHDVKALIDFLPQLERKLGIQFTNKEKYLVGRSRGGMQMFLALIRYPELQHYFSKAIAVSGILDLKEYLKERKEMETILKTHFKYDGSSEWIKKRNPIEHIHQIRKELPILIVQGTDDIRVSLQTGYNMLNALKKRGCAVEYLEIDGASHSLKNIEENVDLLIQWLEAGKLS